MARIVSEKHDVIPQLAELFRAHGYAATSLSLITGQTGLGKGSLYHFFPGGKPEMVNVVLASINDWFEDNIFSPLENDARPQDAIEHMFSAVTEYFRSGQRICLVGAMALDSSRDPFAEKIAGYFRRWISALTSALLRAGFSASAAGSISRETIGGLQGAIVLSRAIDDTAIFIEAVSALRARCVHK